MNLLKECLEKKMNEDKNYFSSSRYLGVSNTIDKILKMRPNRDEVVEVGDSVFDNPPTKPSNKSAVTNCKELLRNVATNGITGNSSPEDALEVIDDIKTVMDCFNFAYNEGWDLWSAVMELGSQIYDIQITNDDESIGYYLWLLVKDGFIKSFNDIPDFGN